MPPLSPCPFFYSLPFNPPIIQLWRDLQFSFVARELLFFIYFTFLTLYCLCPPFSLQLFELGSHALTVSVSPNLEYPLLKIFRYASNLSYPVRLRKEKSIQTFPAYIPNGKKAFFLF